MTWVYVASSETIPLMFIGNVTAEKRNRMNCDVHRTILCSDSAKYLKTDQTVHHSAN